MKSYKELDDLRIKLNSDYSKMLKENIINKNEFNLCIKQINLNIKQQYEKDGFKTDFLLKESA